MGFKGENPFKITPGTLHSGMPGVIELSSSKVKPAFCKILIKYRRHSRYRDARHREITRSEFARMFVRVRARARNEHKAYTRALGTDLGARSREIACPGGFSTCEESMRDYR